MGRGHFGRWPGWGWGGASPLLPSQSCLPSPPLGCWGEGLWVAPALSPRLLTANPQPCLLSRAAPVQTRNGWGRPPAWASASAKGRDAVPPRASLAHRTSLQWCHFRSGLCEGQKGLFALFSSRCSGTIGVGPVGRDVSASNWDISGASPSSPHTAHRAVRGRWRPLVSKENPSTTLDTQWGCSRASSIGLSSTLSHSVSRPPDLPEREKSLFIHFK